MTSITLNLPYPPSANHLYADGNARRVKSAKYEAWLSEAGWELKKQLQRIVHRYYTVKVEVHYRFGPPDNRRRDLGNLEKCMSDLLVRHGIIKDDSLIQRAVLEWADITGAQATVKEWGGA
jgi:crossover junction endodeoxyribonuclease RusA